MPFTKAPTKASTASLDAGAGPVAATSAQGLENVKGGKGNRGARSTTSGRVGKPVKASSPRARTTSNRPLAALAVLMIVGSATAGAVLYSSAGGRHDVLALARAVPAGQKFTAEDLRVAEVNGSGFSAVVKEHANQVVGSTALSNLPEGTLLTNQMYQDSPLPEAGHVIVGASLKPGLVPSDAQPGRDVAVWKVGVVNGTEPVSDAQQIVKSARVTEVSSDVAGGNTLLSLDLPRDGAAAYTSAAAAGTVAIAVLPVGS